VPEPDSVTIHCLVCVPDGAVDALLRYPVVRVLHGAGLRRGVQATRAAALAVQNKRKINVKLFRSRLLNNIHPEESRGSIFWSEKETSSPTTSDVYPPAQQIDIYSSCALFVFIFSILHIYYVFYLHFPYILFSFFLFVSYFPPFLIPIFIMIPRGRRQFLVRG
jgi:hypothetical protein